MANGLAISHQDGIMAQPAKIYTRPFLFTTAEWYCMQVLNEYLKWYAGNLIPLAYYSFVCFSQLELQSIFLNMILQRRRACCCMGKSCSGQNYWNTWVSLFVNGRLVQIQYGGLLPKQPTDNQPAIFTDKQWRYGRPGSQYSHWRCMDLHQPEQYGVARNIYIIYIYIYIKRMDKDKRTASSHFFV